MLAGYLCGADDNDFDALERRSLAVIHDFEGLTDPCGGLDVRRIRGGKDGVDRCLAFALPTKRLEDQAWFLRCVPLTQVMGIGPITPFPFRGASRSGDRLPDFRPPSA